MESLEGVQESQRLQTHFGMVLSGFNSPSPTPAKSHSAVPQHRVPVSGENASSEAGGLHWDNSSWLCHGETLRDEEGKGKADLGKDAGAA